MSLKKIAKLTGLTLAAATLLAACGNQGGGSASSTSEEADKTIHVGIMAKNDMTEALWDSVATNLEAEGITLKLTEFTEYPPVNGALDNGDVDVNAFQHYDYLNNWNQENGGDLVAVAETLISPVNLFPGTDGGDAKYSDISELPDGATIAIPDDATNGGRALYVLEAVGLITLEEGVDLVTVHDIVDNPKDLKILELSAEQLPKSLPDVDAAILNNNYAILAEVDYSTSLYKEEVNDNSKSWVNIIAARNDWESSDKADVIKALIKAYQTDENKDIIANKSDGRDIPVWD